MMQSPPDVTIRLRLPPSANRIWRVGENGRVHKAKAYRTWLNDAAWECLVQKATGRIPGRYALRIVTPAMRKDLDNVLKPTGDALQRAGVVTNDRELCRLTIEIDEAAASPEHMILELWSLPGGPRTKRRSA